MPPRTALTSLPRSAPRVSALADRDHPLDRDPGPIGDLRRHLDFVHVVTQPPATKHVLGSNACRVHVRADERTGRVLAIGVIDNLVKGAAGQAVQAFNMVPGLAETAATASTVWPSWSWSSTSATETLKSLRMRAISGLTMPRFSFSEVTPGI